MADERSDVIPEAAIDAGLAATKWPWMEDYPDVQRWRRDFIRGILAAAAPLLPEGGEAGLPGAEAHRATRGDEVETGQNFGSWFTDYPSTHRLAGQSVEVVPRAALDARSGADTVKLAEDLRQLRRMAEGWEEGCEHPRQFFGPLIDGMLAELAPGADRPEGSQT